MVIENCEVADADGHGMVVGSPTTGLACIRVIVRNCDFNGITKDASKLISAHGCWFVSDNSVIEYSGINYSNTTGALFLSGKNVSLINHRFLGGGTGTPVNIDGVSGRTADGILIDGFALPAPANVTNVVDVAAGQGSVEVVARNLQGTFTGLANNATETNRAGERSWSGSLTIPQLTTTTLATFERANNVVSITNRTGSSGPVEYKRIDGSTIGITNAGTATADATSPADVIYTLPSRSANLLVVTGSYNDSGTVRRFADVLLFMWGLTPNVISSEVENSPATRSYSASNGDLKLSVSADTYAIKTYGHGTVLS